MLTCIHLAIQSTITHFHHLLHWHRLLVGLIKRFISPKNNYFFIVLYKNCHFLIITQRFISVGTFRSNTQNYVRCHWYEIMTKAVCNRPTNHLKNSSDFYKLKYTIITTKKDHETKRIVEYSNEREKRRGAISELLFSMKENVRIISAGTSK